MDGETQNTASKKSEGEGSIRDKWPEVVGLTAEEAERRIKEKNPELQFQVVGPDHMVTMDFRLDRVRIFVDSEEKVTSTPRIG